MDREKVIRHIVAEISIAKTCKKDFAQVDIDMLSDALALLKEQEAASAHWDDDTGHWIEGDRNGINPHTRTTGEMIDTFRCSWCGFYQYWKTPFCPNCGAKMEGR